LAEGVTAADLDAQDQRLLTVAQAAFPLVPRPFAALARAVGLDEEETIARLAACRERRLVRRIGPVFEPAALGLTTELVAVEVEPDATERVGSAIAAWPQVTHCYLRNHRINLWFAGAASSVHWFEQASSRVAAWDGVLGAWRLPALRRFKIGVLFDLVRDQTSSEPAVARPAAHTPGGARRAAGKPDVERVRVIETDLPLAPAPFALLGSRLPVRGQGLLGTIREWLRRGWIRRYGAQLSHRMLGFTANAMVTWVVPSGEMEKVGSRMASDPEVTHCYERPAFDDFPYDLYAMIHGRSREQCLAVADRLSQACGIGEPLPLFSTREFKKSAPPYSELMAAAAGHLEDRAE